MRTLLFAISVLISLCFAPLALAVSCFVYTEQQLRDALDEVAICNNGGVCIDCCGAICQTKRIIVPALDAQSNPVVIAFENPISIGEDHEGLELTINGTLQWAGDDGCANCKLFEISGASHITINGTGTIKAPSSIVFPDPEPPNEIHDLPRAFVIANCTDIEIDGLTIENLGWIVEQIYSPSFGIGPSYNIRLKNITGRKLWDYGVWLAQVEPETPGGVGALIENCHLGDSLGGIGTYRLHGFRLYGENINVINSSAYNIERRPLWRVNGAGSVIDGFAADSQIHIGPDHACNQGSGDHPDAGERLTRVEVLNVTAPSIQIENGVLGLYLENVDASPVGIGRNNATEPNAVPRPLNRIRWKDLSEEPDPYTSPGTNCLGEEYGEWTCHGDVNYDGDINVQDLLAVINDWGTCNVEWNDPLGGTCASLPNCVTPVPCFGDIADSNGASLWGDGTVNVQDLLAVINNWGSCPQAATLDQEVDDCFDYATEELELEPYTQEWLEAVEQCLKGAYGLL